MAGLYRALPICIDARKDGDVDLSRLVQLRDTLVRSAQHSSADDHNGGGTDRPGIGNGTPGKHLGHYTRYLLFASLPPYELCKPHIPTIKQLSCDIIALLPNLAVFSYRSRSTILTNMIPVLLDTAGRSRGRSSDEDGTRREREGNLRMVHSVCAASWRDVEGGVGWALGRNDEGGCEGMRGWLVGATTGTRSLCADSSPSGGGGGRTRLCPSEMLKWRRLTFARVVLSSACDYCCHLQPLSSEPGSNPPEAPSLSSSSTSTSSHEPQPNPNLTQLFLLATHPSHVHNFPAASDHSIYANNFHTNHDPDPIDTTLLCVTSPCTRRFLQVQGRYLKTVYIDVDYFGKEALQELLYLLTRYSSPSSSGSLDGETGSGSSSGTSSPTSSFSPSGSVTDSGYYSGSIYDSGEGGEEGRMGLNVILLLDRWDQFPSDLHVPVGIKALGVHVRTPWRSHPWHVSKGLKSASITPYSDSLEQDGEGGKGVDGSGGSEIARMGGRRVRGGLEVIRFFNEEKMPGVKAVCARVFGKGLRVEDVDDWGG